MSKPLTMTVEREAWIREHGAGVTPQSWQPGVTMLRDLLAEVDALRTALAAAEAKLELQGFEYVKALAEVELALGADIHALEAKLADERKHADALADKLSILALGRINRTEVTAHFARRNAEKEER